MPMLKDVEHFKAQYQPDQNHSIPALMSLQLNFFFFSHNHLNLNHLRFTPNLGVNFKGPISTALPKTTMGRCSAHITHCPHWMQGEVAEKEKTCDSSHGLRVLTVIMGGQRKLTVPTPIYRILPQVHPEVCHVLASTLTYQNKQQPNCLVLNIKCVEAFEALKQPLCTSHIHKCLNLEHPFVLKTDASDCGVGY